MRWNELLYEHDQHEQQLSNVKQFLGKLNTGKVWLSVTVCMEHFLENLKPSHLSLKESVHTEEKTTRGF